MWGCGESLCCCNLDHRPSIILTSDPVVEDSFLLASSIVEDDSGRGYVGDNQDKGEDSQDPSL